MSTDSTLHVTGGAGGVTAHYDDMLTHAAALDRLAQDVAARLLLIAGVATNQDVVACGVLSPGTLAAVAAHVAQATGGPHGLVVVGARFTATSTALRVAVAGYGALDRTLATLQGWAEAVFAIPVALAPLSAGGGLMLQELMAGQLWALGPTWHATLDATTKNLYANPWIVDGVIKNVPFLLTLGGGGLSTVFGPATQPVLDAWSRSHGGRFPPGSLEEATADTIAFGSAFGLFPDGTAKVTPYSDNGFGPLLPRVTAPNSVTALVSGIGETSFEERVRVFKVAGPDGARRWVVEIPGTKLISTVTPSQNSFDMTTNLRIIAGQDATQMEAVREAMRQAGIPPGEDVLLAGHSQGGMVAGALAADPATRQEFHITNVVIAGSPIARNAIPSEVHVLSLEHTQDAVPRLDGEANPDTPNWVTVQRDPTGLQDGNEVVDTTGETHGLTVYAQTGALVDRSEAPSLVGAREALQPFFGSDPTGTTYQDYHVTRTLP